MSAHPRNRDRAIASLLGLALVALLVPWWHSAFWGDWRFLIQLTDAGVWRYHHLLYLPLAHGARALGGCFGASAETSLLALSTCAVAASGSVTFLAARAAGHRYWIALTCGVLLASAPVAFFFATCVEVHALQLLAAALAVLWAVRTERSSAHGTSWSVVPGALLWIALVGTHITGVVWALPLLLFWWTCRRQAPARHTAIAAVGLIAFLALWAGLNPSGASGNAQAALGFERLSGRWTLKHVWYEVLRAGGALHFLAIGALLLRPRLRRPLALAALGLYAAFFPLAIALKIFEWGGYYISLLPVAALGAASTLSWLAQRVPRTAVLLALSAIGVHGWRSPADVVMWHEDFPDAGWVLPLVELCEDGVVFAADTTETTTLFSHSRITVVNLGDPSFDVRVPALRSAAQSVLLDAQVQGCRVGMTASAFELPGDAPAALRDLLRATFGEPQLVAGGSLVYPQPRSQR